MHTAKNMDFNHFCGEMTESIAYLDEEIGGESPIFKNNLLNFRTFPKNLPSYTSEIDLLEAMSIEEQLINRNAHNSSKYKCFRCYGTNRDIDAMNGLESLCSECDGSQFITESHGLASILQKVLMIKLPNLMQKGDELIRQNTRKSRDLNSFFGSQKSIQEEESSLSYVDETFKQCSACYNEFDSFQMFCCNQCKDFAICNACFEKKKYSHPLNHQLVNKELHKISLRYENPKTMKKISEEVESDETSNYLDSSQCIELKCQNCNHFIEECYEACLDCERQGFQFIICAQCSQNRNYKHEDDHMLGMKTLAQASKLLRLSSKPSKTESEITQPTPPKSRVQTKESLINFDNFQHEQSEEQEEVHHDVIFSKFSHDQHYDDLGNSQKQNIYRYPIIDTFKEFEDSPQNEDSGEDLSHLLVKKKCKKMEESMINIEMECSMEMPSEKYEDFTETVAPVAFSTTTNQRIQSKRPQPNPEEYLFNDYQCDICKMYPIKNRRYHCKQCENFDLCEMCFIIRSKKHEHKDYQLIDGQQILKKQRETIMKLQQTKNRLSCSRISMSRVRLSEFSNNLK